MAKVDLLDGHCGHMTSHAFIFIPKVVLRTEFMILLCHNP
jgi:hypothetical protein